MENKSHAVAAGAFVLAIAALLVALAAWLMRDTSEQRVFEISSSDGVTGLQSQAGVRYKGVLVGRVTDIALDTQTRGNVLVRIAVNDSVPITTATYASLGFQGVTGLAFIQLDDAGESSQTLASSTAQVGRIPMRPGMVSRLTSQGGQLLDQLEQASGRANTLLAADNQKALMVAITNMGQAAASIQQLTQRADQMLGSGDGVNLPRLVAQTEVTLRSMQATSDRLGASADAVKTSADEFKQMSARMNEPGGTLDKIAQSTDVLASTGKSLNVSLVPRLNRTADEATRTVRQMGRVVDAVNETPQSLILGRGAAQPGPGEPGFSAPARR
jgi:phospholipid/cholesterol/gamma-HCH transport system substrate-binding protein